MGTTFFPESLSLFDIFFLSTEKVAQRNEMNHQPQTKNVLFKTLWDFFCN
jgi:hypothetical protein